MSQNGVSRSNSPATNSGNLASVLNRNIDALQKRRQKEERKASTQDKIAEVVTAFTGSMAFVYIHLNRFRALDRLERRLRSWGKTVGPHLRYLGD